MLDRFNELAANYSVRRGEFARLQDAIDAADAWSLDTTLEIAMDALRLPPGTPTSRRSPAASAAASRSAGCCSPRPTCCCSTSRRTTSTPSRGVARDAPRGVQGHGRGGDPRPLLPRQRRRLDPSSTAARLPVRRQLHATGSSRSERLEQEEGGSRAPAHDRRERVDAQVPKGGDEGERPARVRGAARRGQHEKLDLEIQIPAGPRLGDVVSSPRTCARARRQAADRGPLRSAAAGRHRRRDRPTARARRRCSG